MATENQNGKIQLIEVPPPTVESLEQLTDEARTMYEADESGGYRLKPSARDAIAEVNAELEQSWETFQTGLAERDAKLAHQTAEIKRLEAAGVQIHHVGTEFIQRNDGKKIHDVSMQMQAMLRTRQ